MAMVKAASVITVVSAVAPYKLVAVQILASSFCWLSSLSPSRSYAGLKIFMLQPVLEFGYADLRKLFNTAQ